MSDVAVPPVSTHPVAHAAHPSPDHHAPVTPGKVAMWLFLATEIMFFTGLIGSYIVLRAGSPSTYYSNLYAPTTNMKEVENTYGVLLHSAGSNPSQVEEAIRAASPDLNAEEVHKLVEEAHEGSMVNRLSKEKAQALHDQLAALGADVKTRAAGHSQMAQALRRADEPAEHQPHGIQYLRADLLVGDHGPGALGHPAGQERPMHVLPGGDGHHRLDLPEHPDLRVLRADGGPALHARHQCDRPFPPQRQPVRLVLLHHDGLSRTCT